MINRRRDIANLSDFDGHTTTRPRSRTSRPTWCEIGGDLEEQAACSGHGCVSIPVCFIPSVLSTGASIPAVTYRAFHPFRRRVCFQLADIKFRNTPWLRQPFSGSNAYVTANPTVVSYPVGLLGRRFPCDVRRTRRACHARQKLLTI